MNKHSWSQAVEVGDRFSNRFGSYSVIEYHGSAKVKIRWDITGYEQYCQAHDAARGMVKDPFAPDIFGVGYYGAQRILGNKCEKSYVLWRSMLQRCYDESKRHQWKSYADCTVCPDWHNYQNFKEWFESNYIEGFELDKDILYKGNKTYCPEKCSFVPRRINGLVIPNKSCRGDFPIGVTMRKKVTPRYIAACVGVDGKQVPLGTYDTPEQAFFAYKIFKESVIKTVANEYKDTISEAVYNALMNWEVEITD